MPLTLKRSSKPPSWDSLQATCSEVKGLLSGCAAAEPAARMYVKPNSGRTANRLRIAFSSLLDVRNGCACGKLQLRYRESSSGWRRGASSFLTGRLHFMD